MFKNGLLSAVAAVAMVLGAAGAGHAGVISWTISKATFSDGGTLNGTFSVDASTGDITAYDLVTTPGTDGSFPGFGSFPGPTPTQFGTEYTPDSPDAWFAGTNWGYPAFMQAVTWGPDDGYVFTSLLELTNLPVTHGGTYDLTNAGDEVFTFDAEFPTGVGRTLTGGVAVGVGGVPEPATWAMLILGLGMIGFAARRSRAGAAVAA